MRRFTISTAALVVLLTPLALLGAIGTRFLFTPADPETAWAVAALLSELPENGRPVWLAISAPRSDCWERLPDEPVGCAYARRDPATGEIKVLSAVHSHHGILVDYVPERDCYRSVCYGDSFDLNGNFIHDEDSYGRSNFDQLQVIPARVRHGELLVNWTALARGPDGRAVRYPFSHRFTPRSNDL